MTFKYAITPGNTILSHASCVFLWTIKALNSNNIIGLSVDVVEDGQTRYDATILILSAIDALE